MKLYILLKDRAEDYNHFLEKYFLKAKKYKKVLP